MTGAGRDGLLYSASLVLPRLPSFLLLPLLATRLSFAGMGLLTTCWIFMDLFQNFAGLGMRQAVGRFFPLAATPPERCEVLTTALSATLAGSAVCAVLAVLAWSVPVLRGSLAFLSALDLRLLITLVLASSLGNLSSTLIVYFRAERRPLAFFAASLCGALVELAGLLVLLRGKTLEVADLMAVEAGKQAVMLLLVGWQGKADLRPAVSGARFASLWAFSMWLVPVGVCDYLAQVADRFWLGELEGLGPMGIYGFFARFATPLGVLYGGAVMEMHSRLFALRGEAGADFARERLGRFLRRAGWTALGVSAAFPLAYRLGESLWPSFPKGYGTGLALFPVLIAGVYLLYWGRHYGAVLEYRFRSKAVLLGLGLSALAACVLIPSAILACRRLGAPVLEGTALAALVSIGAGTVTLGWLARLGGNAKDIARGAAFLAGCLLCATLAKSIGM
jgi:O-antigen/teichoic acid export membrane protein